MSAKRKADKKQYNIVYDDHNGYIYRDGVKQKMFQSFGSFKKFWPGHFNDPVKLLISYETALKIESRKSDNFLLICDKFKKLKKVKINNKISVVADYLPPYSQEGFFFKRFYLDDTTGNISSITKGICYDDMLTDKFTDRIFNHEIGAELYRAVKNFDEARNRSCIVRSMLIQSIEKTVAKKFEETIIKSNQESAIIKFSLAGSEFIIHAEKNIMWNNGQPKLKFKFITYAKKGQSIIEYDYDEQKS